MHQANTSASNVRIPSVPRTDASLDLQVSLLTDHTAVVLARAQSAGADPDGSVRAHAELAEALKLAKTSGELAVAKARLKGELHLRYQILKVDGKAAARLARNDYWPEGLTEEEATALSDEEIVARMALPPSPRRGLMPKNEPEDKPQLPNPDLPSMTENELHSPDGFAWYTARCNAALAAKAAREAADKAEAAAQRLLAGPDAEDDEDEEVEADATLPPPSPES